MFDFKKKKNVLPFKSVMDLIITFFFFIKMCISDKIRKIYIINFII